MAFKIEKGKTMPTARTKHGPYPFHDMKVGDSFLIPNEELTGLRNIRAVAYAAGKRLKQKYSTRSVDDGIRIWRIK